MFCTLIGITPVPGREEQDVALLSAWYETIQTNVRSTASASAKEEEEGASPTTPPAQRIQWIGHSTATDPDHHGDGSTRTWILSALCDQPAIPEDVVEALSQFVQHHSVRITADTTPGNAATIIEPTNFVVELWASSPAPLPLRPASGYGDKIILSDDFCNHDVDPSANTSNDPKNYAEKACAVMLEWGVFLQCGILRPDTHTDDDAVTDLRILVDQAILHTHELLALHRPEINVGTDDFCFSEIASRGRERFDLRLTDARIMALVEQRIVQANPRMRAFLEIGLSSSLEEIDFDVAVVYSRPGATDGLWHADGDHPKGANDAGWELDGWKTRLAKPYAICLFLPLIDLDDDTGFTQFWPGSHRHKDLFGFGPVAQLAEANFDGKCRAGDGVFYDYRLFHRGTANRSRDILRPVVQIIFKKKWYVEKSNYGVESIVR